MKKSVRFRRRKESLRKQRLAGKLPYIVEEEQKKQSPLIILPQDINYLKVKGHWPWERKSKKNG